MSEYFSEVASFTLPPKYCPLVHMLSSTLLPGLFCVCVCVCVCACVHVCVKAVCAVKPLLRDTTKIRALA